MITNELCKRIEENLKEYDLILLVETEDRGGSGSLWERLSHSKAFQKSGKKTLLLPLKEYEEPALVYSTYEFSDRFKVIKSSSRYGSLMNFVDSGLLTEEEAFEAILY